MISVFCCVPVGKHAGRSRCDAVLLVLFRIMPISDRCGLFTSQQPVRLDTDTRCLTSLLLQNIWMGWLAARTCSRVIGTPTVSLPVACHISRNTFTLFLLHLKMISNKHAVVLHPTWAPTLDWWFSTAEACRPGTPPHLTRVYCSKGRRPRWRSGAHGRPC